MFRISKIKIGTSEIRSRGMFLQNAGHVILSCILYRESETRLCPPPPEKKKPLEEKLRAD